MTDAIKEFVPELGVLIIAGDDWNSMTPFYAQRKALMIRRNMENESNFINEAFANLQDESVSALILQGDQQNNRELADAVSQRFGLEAIPALNVNGTTARLSDQKPLISS